MWTSDQRDRIAMLVSRLPEPDRDDMCRAFAMTFETEDDLHQHEIERFKEACYRQTCDDCDTSTASEYFIRTEVLKSTSRAKGWQRTTAVFCARCTKARLRKERS